MHPSCLMIGDPGLDGGREGWGPCGQGTPGAIATGRCLVMRFRKAALPLGCVSLVVKHRLLVHGEEVAEAD